MEQYYKSVITGAVRSRTQWVKRIGGERFKKQKVYGLLIAI